MESISILPSSGFKTSEWSGGTTTELFIWPKDASYSERRFKIRISTALVSLESSTFTRLEGVKRFLTPLCKGFELMINGEKKSLPYGEVLEFSGEDEVECFGSGRDLNLMLKGETGEMRIVKGAFTVPEVPHAFVYSPEAQAVAFCKNGACSSALLCRGDLARITPGEYSAEGSLVLFTAG